MKIFLSADTEASGPVPGLFDMISVGLVVIEPGLTRTFYGEFAPLHDLYSEGAYKSIGMTREQHLAMPNAGVTTFEMYHWLMNLNASRILTVSDNPGFDFAFLVWYLEKFVGKNPLGHSARRIGDFSAGLKNNFMETQGWKKLRRTAHTHHPVDDAKGNAEALMTLMDNHGLKAPWHAK
jgi:hypothetical protein